MIVGGSKKQVIENIKTNIKNNELNKKVEVDDPNLSEEELDNLVDKFYKIRQNKVQFKVKSKLAKKMVNDLNNKLNANMEIIGIENIKNINTGAIITSNHFNPLDSLPIRKMVKELFKKDLYTVTDAANLALPGDLSFIVNYLDNIPLKRTPNFIIRNFMPNLKKVLDDKNYVLIYPEEEMWFNYRKPRPCKRGAYQFAADANVPIIPCFTQMVDLDKDDNDEFKEVKYIVHILKPIYPKENITSRENSIEMSENDYKQKIEAYEKAYNKKLDYTFSYEDIAGYKKED